MARLRSYIAKFIPHKLVPYGRRIMRRVDQIQGYPSSGKRPGVVLMLHIGRCGSTVLGNLLSQNPKIYWGAKLHRKAKELYGDNVKRLDYPKWTKRQFSISGARYYGFEFKILADQYPTILGTSTIEFLEQCKLIGVTHYILLTRRNTLRHIVSHYASKNRGNWHISQTDSAQLQQFTIDVDHVTTGSAPGRPLIDYLQEVENTHNLVREILSAQDVLEIEYENDIDTKGARYAYHRVCDFLKIHPTEVEVTNKRVNPFPLRDTIQNYDEITKKLKGTAFEWMLER